MAGSDRVSATGRDPGRNERRGQDMACCALEAPCLRSHELELPAYEAHLARHVVSGFILDQLLYRISEPLYPGAPIGVR